MTENPLKTHILCFPFWIEPKNFVLLSANERVLLRKDLEKYSVPPTNINFWVWFGAYNSRGRPVHYNKYIVNRLYEEHIGPLSGRKLSNAMVTTYTDVNPHKYMIGGSGVKWKTELKATETDWGLNQYIDFFENGDSEKLTPEEQNGLDVLSYLPDGVDKKYALEQQGFSDKQIERIMKYV